MLEVSVDWEWTGIELLCNSQLRTNICLVKTEITTRPVALALLEMLLRLSGDKLTQFEIDARMHF